MSQRLIIAIGISGFVGVVLLVALNVIAAFQRGPAPSPGIGTGPTPSATIRGSATPSATPGRSTGSTSPSATASASPTGTPGPGGLEADQSAGSVTLAISAPEAVDLTSPAVCQWAADEPLRVEQIVTAQDTPLEVHGEPIAIQVRTGEIAGPNAERAPLLIRRLATARTDQRASYGLSGANEGEFVHDVGAGGTTGTFIFKGLGTAAATVPADLLPVRRVVFAEPFGRDEAWKAIDGTVMWQCDGAPSGFAPSPATPSPGPDDPAALRAPGVALVLGDVRREGAPGCLEAATSQDGEHTGAEECRSAWVAPEYLPPALAARAGTRVGVSPESGWRIAAWNIRASTVADVEATLGKPKTSVLLFRGDAADPVRSLGFRAPRKGTWIVRATLETTGPGSAAATTTYFFVVRSS